MPFNMVSVEEAWKKPHDPACQCCIMLKRKWELQKLKSKKLSPAEKADLVKSLPCKPGGTGHYKLNPNHIDQCECCTVLRKLRERDRVYSARRTKRQQDIYKKNRTGLI